MAAVNRTEVPQNGRVTLGRLSVDPVFHRFVEDELLPASGIEPGAFWPGLESLIAELTPVNRRLLEVRDKLQKRIDNWHRARRGQRWSHARYAEFLEHIGYVVPAGADFSIDTRDVDPEIAEIAGPQLVVPVNNARFAINAANARWGSLFDAFYGTDVIPEVDGRERDKAGYNEVRGAEVIARALAFLDETVPLRDASHADVSCYLVEIPMRYAECFALTKDGRKVAFADNRQFVGWTGYDEQKSLLFRHNGLHIEICVDPEHAVGRDAPGQICDIVLESAITTIQDCEDSVAAVDAEDKTLVYRNWLGLMTGTLEATFEKDGKRIRRHLNRERKYISPDGSQLILPGTSLMLVRNVGHHMTTDAVYDANGSEVYEGILDAVVTTACAISNTRQKNQLLNSRTGSIYIVKPKMHGPAEAAFADTLFARVEDLFGLRRHTLKIGLMDEERRTTVNLGECIRAVRNRLVFINTGFLDRTGDEIHTAMHAGPVLPKASIKSAAWIRAYEDRNVDTGLRSGLPGKAQIGKGMWPMPDEMRRMLDSKQEHPEAGASCAWVPSPTAATLHALHYHAVDVAQRQQELAARQPAGLRDLLTPPLCDPATLDAETIASELANNAQGILGYVVRWIDHGVGCSKVQDINGVGLMEDRATLRISSQHIANWLLHGVCARDQVLETFENMARLVDQQNAADPDYVPMSDNFDDSVAFQTACALVFQGQAQANGYTEALLQAARRRVKAAH